MERRELFLGVVRAVLLPVSCFPVVVRVEFFYFAGIQSRSDVK